MTSLSSAFATLIRETPAPPPAQAAEPRADGFNYHCPMCGREQWFVLLAEDARAEYYACTGAGCSYQKGWVVR